MKEKILLFFLAIFILSCSSPATPDKVPVSDLDKSPDKRFLGKYIRSELADNSTIFEDNYTTYTFNDNKIYYYRAIMSGDYPEWTFECSYEWKLENEVYHKRILNSNNISSWEEFELEYVDENTIKIEAKEFKLEE